MNINSLYQNWHHHLPALLVLSSAGALGTAYSSEIFFGADPCILCLYQRIPYATIGVIGLILLWISSANTRLWLLAATVLALFTGAGIATYHVGVEQQWWASTCGGSLSQGMTIEQLQLSLTKKAPKACDEIDWTLFGISMATYNVFISSGLAILTATGLLRLRKEQQS